MDWLLNRFSTSPDRIAFTHEGERITYGGVVAGVDDWSARIAAGGIRPGETVAVLGDFSPGVFCLILALARNRNIIIPLTRESVIELSAALSVSGCTWLAEFDPNDREARISERRVPSDSALLEEFRSKGSAGLVFFSSGSTGKPKGDPPRFRPRRREVPPAATGGHRHTLPVVGSLRRHQHHSGHHVEPGPRRDGPRSVHRARSARRSRTTGSSCCLPRRRF